MFLCNLLNLLFDQSNALNNFQLISSVAYFIHWTLKWTSLLDSVPISLLEILKYFAYWKIQNKLTTMIGHGLRGFSSGNNPNSLCVVVWCDGSGGIIAIERRNVKLTKLARHSEYNKCGKRNKQPAKRITSTTGATCTVHFFPATLFWY